MGALLGTVKESHIRPDVPDVNDGVVVTRASDILIDSKPERPDDLSLIARLLLERSEDNGV